MTVDELELNHGDVTNRPDPDILKEFYHIVHDPTLHLLHQWLSTAVILPLMMGTESTRNTYSDLAVKSKH
jgi:hypothetical protein